MLLHGRDAPLDQRASQRAVLEGRGQLVQPLIGLTATLEEQGRFPVCYSREQRVVSACGCNSTVVNVHPRGGRQTHGEKAKSGVPLGSTMLSALPGFVSACHTRTRWKGLLGVSCPTSKLRTRASIWPLCALPALISKNGGHPVRKSPSCVCVMLSTGQPVSRGTNK